MYSPLCAANVPWSFGSLLSCSLSPRWLPAPCILPWCPFPDAFCTLSIYPSMFFSLYVNTCSRSRTSLHVAIFFWRFQPPDALYMLSRLYRKVNPFRSDLLLLLLLLVELEYTNFKLTAIKQEIRKYFRKRCPNHSVNMALKPLNVLIIDYG
jgi:hypothetical protein